jgi:hypothetical protein
MSNDETIPAAATPAPMRFDLFSAPRSGGCGRCYGIPRGVHFSRQQWDHRDNDIRVWCGNYGVGQIARIYRDERYRGNTWKKTVTGYAAWVMGESHSIMVEDSYDRGISAKRALGEIRAWCKSVVERRRDEIPGGVKGKS